MVMMNNINVMFDNVFRITLLTESLKRLIISHMRSDYGKIVKLQIRLISYPKYTRAGNLSALVRV